MINPEVLYAIKTLNLTSSGLLEQLVKWGRKILKKILVHRVACEQRGPNPTNDTKKRKEVKNPRERYEPILVIPHDEPKKASRKGLDKF